MIDPSILRAATQEAIPCRHALHENPQTCYEEVFASSLIMDKLKEWGVSFTAGWAKTGIVATIEGQKNTSGKAIALRADIDALDIVEATNQPWTSKTTGKMHGCGHDGHTAMLLGIARYLSQTRRFNGTVHLIFQPAEEGGAGAVKMIEEGLFEKLKIDSIYGLHNWPNLPRGTIALRSGPTMASSDTFEITITGCGGHAAMPNKCVDPIACAAQIVGAAQTIVSRGIDPVDQAVVSITNFNAGTGASNVIPDKAVLLGTFRSFRPETRAFIRRRLEEITTHIAASMGTQASIIFSDGYDPTINTPEESAFCAGVAQAVVGKDHVLLDIPPSMGAEDFGALLRKVPGCYVRLGQAEPEHPDSPHNKPLHNAGYDFNDSVIPLGISYWASLVEMGLPLEG